MRPVFVLSAARTPIGKFGGSFASLTAADLGEAAAKAAIERSGLPPAAVDETIFGHARQAGGGPNTAAAGRASRRSAGLRSGLHGQQGLRLLAQGDHARSAHDRRGRERRRSRGRHRVACRRCRTCCRERASACGWATPRSSTRCTATASSARSAGSSWARRRRPWSREYAILRAEQDAYAARDAAARGVRVECRPLLGRDRSGLRARQEGQRHGVRRRASARGLQSRSLCGKLPPVFDPQGTVHAGNSSGITDGAAALVLATEEEAEKAGSSRSRAWPRGRRRAWIRR